MARVVGVDAMVCVVCVIQQWAANDEETTTTVSNSAPVDRQAIFNLIDECLQCCTASLTWPTAFGLAMEAKRKVGQLATEVEQLRQWQANALQAHDRVLARVAKLEAEVRLQLDLLRRTSK